MRGDVEAQAIEIVDAAVARRRVDGVADLALALPSAVVPDLIGWPKEGREHLLRWGAASFDFLGPMNRQAVRSIPRVAGMLRFAHRVVKDRSVLPGSMGDEVLSAAERGELPVSECPALMLDYLAPSLDTTLSAIASALHLFAAHPDQWDLLRQDRTLVPNAINEVVRIESPLVPSRATSCATPRSPKTSCRPAACSSSRLGQPRRARVGRAGAL